MVINPTIGRVVWFWNNAQNYREMNLYDRQQPCAAIITYVWNECMVNLTVFDHVGNPHLITSVRLVHPHEQRPEIGSTLFCEWMPYQVGKAEDK